MATAHSGTAPKEAATQQNLSSKGRLHPSGLVTPVERSQAFKPLGDCSGMRTSASLLACIEVASPVLGESGETSIQVHAGTENKQEKDARAALPAALLPPVGLLGLTRQPPSGQQRHLRPHRTRCLPGYQFGLS